MNLSLIESVNEQMFLEEHFDVQNFNGSEFHFSKNKFSFTVAKLILQPV